MLKITDYLKGLDEKIENEIDKIAIKLNLKEEKKEKMIEHWDEYVRIVMSQRVPLKIIGNGIESYFPSKEEYSKKYEVGEYCIELKII